MTQIQRRSGVLNSPMQDLEGEKVCNVILNTLVDKNAREYREKYTKLKKKITFQRNCIKRVNKS